MKYRCWHCNQIVQAGKTHIRVNRYNPDSKRYDYVCKVVDSPLCAFGCGRTATHTTSADDNVCRKCWHEFENALESE
jgi:hypothetical protein